MTTCKDCGFTTDVPETFFYPRPNLDSYQSYCKVCVRRRASESHRRNYVKPDKGGGRMCPICFVVPTEDNIDELFNKSKKQGYQTYCKVCQKDYAKHKDKRKYHLKRRNPKKLKEIRARFKAWCETGVWK